MVDEQAYNELDRYFTGRMQGDERVAFELQLSSDANLKAELDWIVNATAAMKNSGRSVMKQHIATMLTGISAGEIAKYTPAKNKISFWKKWWWAVSIAVAIATAVAVYEVVTYHDESSPTHDQMQEGEAIPSTETNVAPAVDSCIDSAAPEKKIDSAIQAIDNEKIREETEVSYVSNEKERTQRVSPRNDSVIPIVTAYGWNSNVVGSKDKKKPMGVILGYKPTGQATYILETDLTLNSPYTSTKGFTFDERGGDTVYMTDNNGLHYMLLRNHGVQNLLPMRDRAVK